MRLTTITPAASYPVTAAEAKLFCRIDHADEDTFIEEAIAAATDWCERHCRRKFINTTLRQSFDRFPAGSFDAIQLLPTVQSIVTVAYTAADGSAATLTSDEYQMDSVSEPARLTPAYGSAWPATRPDTPNALNITYVCGYGATAASVPPGLKIAIKQLIGHWYETREVGQPAATLQVPIHFQDLLRAYRVYQFPE